MEDSNKKIYELLPSIQHWGGVTVLKNENNRLITLSRDDENMRDAWNKHTIISVRNFMDAKMAIAVNVIKAPKEGEGFLILPDYAIDRLQEKDIKIDLLLDFYKDTGDFEYDGPGNYQYSDEIIYHGFIPDDIAQYAVVEQGWRKLYDRLRKCLWITGINTFLYVQVMNLLKMILTPSDLLNVLPTTTINEEDYWKWESFKRNHVELGEDVRYSAKWRATKDMFDKAAEYLDLLENVTKQEHLALFITSDDFVDDKLPRKIIDDFLALLPTFESTLDTWRSGVPISDIFA